MTEVQTDPNSLAVTQSHKVGAIVKGMHFVANSPTQRTMLEETIQAAAEYAHTPEVMLKKSLENIQELSAFQYEKINTPHGLYDPLDDTRLVLGAMESLAKHMNAQWPRNSYLETFAQFTENVSAITVLRDDMQKTDEAGLFALDYFLSMNEKTHKKRPLKLAMAQTADEITTKSQKNAKALHLLPMIASAYLAAAYVSDDAEKSRLATDPRDRYLPMPYEQGGSFSPAPELKI